MADRLAMLREKYQEAGGDEEEVAAPEEASEATEAEEAPTEEAAAEPAPEAEGEPKEAPAGRDEKGRFASQPGGKREEKPAGKPAAAPVAKPAQAAAPTEKPPAAPAAPATKPPQSWSHAEREAWAKTPPEAQRAILRREQETTQVLQQNAQLRRTAEEAGRRVNEYENFVRNNETVFRLQGIDPMQGIANVVQTYALLNTGSQQQRDVTLAQLVAQYGTLDGINAVLQGHPGALPQHQAPRAMPQQQPPDARAIVQEELDRRMEEARRARADQDFNAFRATNPEFLEVPSVWQNMERYLDMATAQGRNPGFQEAYDFAVQMDPEIRATLSQRAAAAAATQPNAQASTARARAAAATVRPKPTATVGAAPDLTDRRAMLQAAAERSRTR